MKDVRDETLGSAVPLFGRPGQHGRVSEVVLLAGAGFLLLGSKLVLSMRIRTLRGAERLVAVTPSEEGVAPAAFGVLA